MKLKIITQERVVFDQDNVDEIYTKGIDGEFGILKGHIPVMCALDIGVTRAVIGDVHRSFTTMGGILQFKDDECLILTTLAETDEEIDKDREQQPGNPTGRQGIQLAKMAKHGAVGGVVELLQKLGQ